MKFLLWMSVPLCRTCVHYIPDERFSSMSRCKKMSTIDVNTGEIEYSSAISVREHECQGKLYEPEPRLALKMWKHDVKKNAKYIVYALIYLSLFAYTKIK